MIKRVKECDLEWIANKSLRNCHVVGLDSILFDDTPESRVRCFIAGPKHDLFKNCEGSKLSVALHSHHCDVKLAPVFGEIWNLRPSVLAGRAYMPFKYVSAITGGGGSFIELDSHSGLARGLDGHELKRPFQMQAAEYHTVFVPADREAAWFVHEGKEDDNYSGIAYSNDDLASFDFSPLYKPMTVEYLRILLDKIGVKIA